MEFLRGFTLGSVVPSVLLMITLFAFGREGLATIAAAWCTLVVLGIAVTD